MNTTNIEDNLTTYPQIAIQDSVSDANPHQLIQMLMESVLERIEIAKIQLSQNQIAEKGLSISSAIAIIDNLMISLDKNIGGEIAENLDALYSYMNRRLLEANFRNDSLILDEVISLIAEVKSGWDNIPEDVKNAHELKDKYQL